MQYEKDQRVAGRYRLLTPLGEGSMGVAWRAHDEHMRRDVALKQLRLPATGTHQREVLVARMEREARAAGRLRHPNIITVYDQFRDEDDLPWIVMDLVPGPSLAGLLESAGPVSPEEAGRIGAHVAEALAAAHAQGVVHRDIKPGNILLEEGRSILTDFGIASLDDASTALTATGTIVGTPAYLAPEQIRGESATPASDLWSLGATLYTAVEGRAPFQAPNTAALLFAISRAEHEPPRNADRLAPVLRALMNPVPAARPSAAEAAALLRDAAPQGPAVPAPRTSSALRQATALSTSPLEPTTSPTVHCILLPEPCGPPLEGHAGVIRAVAFSPDGRLLASGDSDGTMWLWDLERRAPAAPPVSGHATMVDAVAFSPDGRLLASSGDHAVRLWDTETLTPAGEPLRGHTHAVRSVAFSPDGLLLASGGTDGTVRVWDLNSPAPVSVFEHSGWVLSVAFSPDGRLLAGSSSEGSIRLWDMSAHAPFGPPIQDHRGSVACVAFSPDGRLLAGCGSDRTVRLWDAATLAPVGSPLREHEGWVLSLAFSPDGRLLAGGGEDGTVRLWDTAAHVAVGDPLTTDSGSVEALAFSPDGRLLATGGSDQELLLWRMD
ncbi:WD40 repeat domain-containing serine/threonine protein kinase [Actinocorallia populi]|uniref:WD40 repeat domain-containing serine/threonine protein kinase n=1 Tax=Actinocorallia populi TaxID=2079200 RepID=UPI0018E517D2|nr:serine/threonine-protein kinase [Actinocorallia populi]